jgi:hypothetical protein
VFAIGLGIGANTANFGVVNALQFQSPAGMGEAEEIPLL